MSIVLDWNWSGQIIVPMIDDGLKVDLNPFLDKDWSGGATIHYLGIWETYGLAPLTYCHETSGGGQA